MKTIFLGTLAALCFLRAGAQSTNTDSQGYVTNAALLAPFTLTNSSGTVFTDAVFVKITANKFFYKTGNGTMGTRRLDTLTPALLAQVGYDPTNAAAADAADNQKASVWQHQREVANRQAIWNAAWERAQSKRQATYGDVIQKIDEGLLVSVPGHYGAEMGIRSVTVLVKNHPREGTCAAGDQIFIRGFDVGLFSYTTVNNSDNTIHVLNCDTNEAVQYYMEH